MFPVQVSQIIEMPPLYAAPLTPTRLNKLTFAVVKAAARINGVICRPAT